MASMPLRLRDVFRRYTPPWLADRIAAGLVVGFKLLWAMIAPLDAAMDVLIAGIKAAWPGLGTPTALPYVGRTRGIIRGQDETDEAYAERLRGWLDTWREAGSGENLIRQIHTFLRSHPRVRVVTRSGIWITINEDGSVERHDQAWDWDSVSNPERADYWSEIWLVVYTDQWPTAGPFIDTGVDWGEDELGIGHDVTREEYDAVRGLIAQWKAAHTMVRAVIWTTDDSLFDPETPGSLPDGTWGQWSIDGVASGRDLTVCRYWEF